MYNIGQLKQKQSLPLEYKEKMTVGIVEEFISKYDAYVSIAGVDSFVLNDLLERNGIFLPKVSISRAEPKGNNAINATKGTIFLVPDMEKKDIIRERGYPIISKQLSMAVSRWTKTKDPAQKEYRMFGGEDEEGNKLNAGVIPIKYRELVYAPFLMTETCCDIIKKRPLKRWAKDNNKHPITGEMAAESKARQDEWLKHGCIMDDKKTIKCTPFGFWTPRDIIDYVLKYDIKVSDEYGKPIRINDSQLSLFAKEIEYKWEKAQRTGCDICTFGIMHDMKRFKRMKDNKPNQWVGMMNGGEFIHTGEIREVKLVPHGEIIRTDMVWVPNNVGYGYRYVIDYLNRCLNISIEI